MKKFYIGALAVIFLCYGLLIGQFFSLGCNVMPVDDDETQHYNNAKLFSQYASLKASDVISEDVSKVGECDWYGPLYPIFFGALNKLMGNFNRGYIVTNILLLSLIVLLVFQFKGVEIKDKLWLAMAILVTPSVLRYLFYFMPSIIDLFFAAVLVYSLFNIVNSDASAKNRNIFIYFVLTVLFALFKENFIFALTGILPFATGKKQVFFFIVFCALGLIIVLIYASFFLAPAYVAPLAAVQNIIKLGFSNIHKSLEAMAFIFKWCWMNIKRILVPDMSMHLFLPLYYFVFLLPIFNLIAGYRIKNKLLLSLGLIGFVTNIVFIALYNAAWYFIIRISVPYVFIGLAGFTQYAKYKSVSQFAWIILFGVMFLFNLKAVTNRFQYMIDSYCRIKVGQGVFSNIQNRVGCNDGKVTTILYDDKFWDNYGQTFILALPLVDKCNGRIRYTVNLGEGNKFKLWGKMKVDYILSAQELHETRYKLIEGNKYYYLYKI